MREDKYIHLIRIGKKNTYNQHLKYIWKYGWRHFPSPVQCFSKIDKEVYYDSEELETMSDVVFRRSRKSNHAGKHNRYGFYKRQSHRAVRYYKGDIPMKGCGSNKLFDYWWTVD